MNLESASKLQDILEKTDIFYICCDPEVPDFTNHSSCKVLIFNKVQTIEFELTRQNVALIAGIFQTTIFSSKIKTLIGWNLKPLFTYLTYYLPKQINVESFLLDLFVIENFLGFSLKAPKNLIEAINRVKRISEKPSWKKIYQKIHLPLITKILPQIESFPLLDEGDKLARYAYYEIEGQRNGRLRCCGKYDRSYVPHTMGDEIKLRLKPRGRENVFLLTDINNCEVTVLQHLSGDPKLQQFLFTGKDVYEQIYNLITGDVCDTVTKRDICKLTFLPVIYGCGSKGLSKNINVSELVAKDLIKRMNHYFPVAMEWVGQQEYEAKTKGYLTDALGRVRTFNEENYYTSRNFIIQAPAATVCLEKLIEIQELIKVAFTVHDSYCLVCKESEVKETHYKIKSIIEKESIICPGLTLKMHSKFGYKLTDLQNLK